MIDKVKLGWAGVSERTHSSYAARIFVADHYEYCISRFRHLVYQSQCGTKKCTANANCGKLFVASNE